MKDEFYTFTYWKVKENNVEEFLHIWEKDFASVFIRLNPYSKITLLQSLENPNIYYSFGPWTNLEQMQSSRANENYRSVLSRLISLCSETRQGSFKNVLSISGSK
jgi:hypothetical protein